MMSAGFEWFHDLWIDEGRPSSHILGSAASNPNDKSLLFYE